MTRAAPEFSGAAQRVYDGGLVRAHQGYLLTQHRVQEQLKGVGQVLGQVGPRLLAVCALAAAKGRPDPWDWSLVGVFAAQLAVWTAATHEMPARFLVPALVPMSVILSQ